MPRSMIRFLFQEKILVILITVSVLLIAWQRWGMNSTLVLNASHPWVRASAIDDHIDGGNSVCSTTISSDRWRLNYDVRPGVSWAFCGINFKLAPVAAHRGIDLSRYDTMEVFLSRMQGVSPSLQIQVKTMDSSIYKPSDGTSLKYMAATLFPSSSMDSKSIIPMGLFSVPTWWISRYRLPVDHQSPNWSDVREVEFLTTNGKVVFGTGTVEIRRIEFRGKWIRQDRLLYAILAVWFLCALGALTWRLFCSIGNEHELQNLAARDPLTGLRNRRGFDDALSALAGRQKDPQDVKIGVLMLDLDNFKKINDTLGHNAGDEVLRQVAGILENHMRRGNLCARWGGEEFLACFLHIPHDGLYRLAERIRLDIESSVEWKGFRITGSIGVAHGLLSDFDTLVKQSDKALYCAKAEGRNRVKEFR